MGKGLAVIGKAFSKISNGYIYVSLASPVYAVKPISLPMQPSKEMGVQSIL